MDMRNGCTRPLTAFVMVPNSLISDPSLSPLAKLVLIYMASHAPGYVVRRAQIMKATGISIRTWYRAARELRARGALQTVPAGQGGYANIRGKYLHADWSEWTANPCPKDADSPPQPVDNFTMGTNYDGRERDPDSDPKGIRTRIPKGSGNKRERKKERACAREEGNAAPGRREDVRGSPRGEPAEIGRVLPSLDRRRQIAAELGLDPATSALWRLSGGATEP